MAKATREPEIDMIMLASALIETVHCLVIAGALTPGMAAGISGRLSLAAGGSEKFRLDLSELNRTINRVQGAT